MNLSAAESTIITKYRFKKLMSLNKKASDLITLITHNLDVEDYFTDFEEAYAEYKELFKKELEEAKKELNHVL